ncbi:Ubl_MoaD_like domain containing protein [Candidatus Nanopelagicaceae bacterium]
MAIVNFYAASRAATGIESAVIVGASLGDVIESAIAQFPELGRIIQRCSYLVNEVATVDTTLIVSAEDRIDVLPQFAGGA